MNKAIFLDRDGTINVDKNYTYRISDFEFIPYAVEGLKLLKEAGYLLIILTNQSGIARGFYTEEDLFALNQWMFQELDRDGIRIDGFYYCPHLPDATNVDYRLDCDCRKPKLRMFYKAVNEFDIDLNNSFSIGDNVRDLEICKDTNCKGYIICSETESRLELNQVMEGSKIKKISSLYEAAKDITGL